MYHLERRRKAFFVSPCVDEGRVRMCDCVYFVSDSEVQCVSVIVCKTLPGGV